MSSLMLRSAINTAAAAARCSLNTSLPKASLSTVSFHPSFFNDAQCEAAVDVSRSAAMPTMNTSNNITSYLSKMVANVSGDLTLATMDYAATQMEEEGEWEDISTAIMESPADDILSELSVWQISTLKRRKKMMNKHKLRKRRKKLRLKTRK
mmetsp:Transcript_3024/g.6622  ORF Transcript_3024/g.6622 Transcript_3024/m.6622 type:complete len:152 (-) Transcript_3024:163-618(-)|eukprot:CAMPEP_0172303244 /NCGR_PEP_ID=MMETSP1058-20130122/4808_1 /TAXON_ID=83371 /ORGANISM="Detonula confervacea, Strain CCMP 353" /LENGTH=151 /DNA_ID=CAMNT_0013013985 /DNA_START=160 /DNA_END=615 /DNA_ORIENTATION=+